MAQVMCHPNQRRVALLIHCLKSWRETDGIGVFLEDNHLDGFGSDVDGCPMSPRFWLRYGRCVTQCNNLNRDCSPPASPCMNSSPARPCLLWYLFSAYINGFVAAWVGGKYSKHHQTTVYSLLHQHSAQSLVALTVPVSFKGWGRSCSGADLPISQYNTRGRA